MVFGGPNWRLKVDGCFKLDIKFRMLSEAAHWRLTLKELIFDNPFWDIKLAMFFWPSILDIVSECFSGPGWTLQLDRLLGQVGY